MLLDKSGKTGLERFYELLAGFAFILNWIWEMAQMFAFEVKPDENRLQIFLFCTLATVIDVLVTIGIYALLSRVGLKKGVFLFYLSAALLGSVCAVLFEWSAVWLEFWKYNSSMPIVPVLQVGLLPFAQLTLLVPLAIWLANKLVRRRSAEVF
jgi:hypothetical protein